MEVLSSRPITGVVVKKTDPTKPQHCLKKLWWEAPMGFGSGESLLPAIFFLPETWSLKKKDGKKICEWWTYHGSLRFKVDGQNKVDCFTICSFLRQKSDFRRHNMTVSNLFHLISKIHLSEINAKSRFGAVVEKTKIWVSLC